MLIWFGFALAAVAATAHVATLLATTVRLRLPILRPAPDGRRPPVTVLRPICGLENHLEACLASSFALTYPAHEIIFCADDEDDQAIPLVRRLIAAHPEVAASLVTGRDRVGANPKLNNLVKGWRAARHDLIVMSDSNALLPPDYIEGLLSRWGARTGMVSTAVAAVMPDGWAAELECAFINSLQARWVLAADSVGFGYALGKTLAVRRETLEKVGGLPVLAEQAAEDIASTHAMRQAGLGIRLARRPVEQPVGRRSLRAVLLRQLRWARLRRAGLRGIYLTEPLSGGAVPIGCVVALAIGGAIPAGAAVGFAVAWYGLETLFTRVAGWPVSVRTPAMLVLRDAILPVLWALGWAGSRFEWRGHAMTVAPPRRERQAMATEVEAESG